MSNIVLWSCRVRSCGRCISEEYLFLCTLISSAYLTINRFSPQIYSARLPRRLLDSLRATTWVKYSKYFLSLFYCCAYCKIEGRLRERIVYPDKQAERWEEEYKALQTNSERDTWIAQKIEERTAINEV